MQRITPAAEVSRRFVCAVSGGDDVIQILKFLIPVDESCSRK